jgi:hypothetical protein
MKKKQKLFLVFTVIAITVIFIMAGCASMAEDVANSKVFPSDLIGTWERVGRTKTLIFTPSTMTDSSQSYYWVLDHKGVYGYVISPSYDTKLFGTVNIKSVDNNLVISDDYLAGNLKYDWSGTWRRINASTNSAEASGVSLNGAEELGVRLISAGELKNYLDGQPDNGPDKPITVAITVNDSMLKDIVEVIKSSDKFVSLNLTGNAVTTIGEDAFKDCTKLSMITIPGSVKNFDQGAFIDCTNLTAINVDSSNTLLSSVDGVLYTKDKTLLVIFPQGYKVTDVSISSSVAPDAFYGSHITSVTLEGGYFDMSIGKLVIPKIYEGAFTNCNSLTRVTVSGSGVELEEGSFDGDLYDLWDKATFLRSNSGITGRDGSFRGTFTRPNGTR